MIKLGIIGYGTIAATYIKSLKHIADCYQLGGLYDINRAKLDHELGDIYTIYDSMEAMLQSNINCVIISTPLNTHYDIAVNCIKANKHVIMEKPATLSLPEVEHLFTLAKIHHVMFYVAFHSSFAIDIEWYLANQATLEPCYRTKNIQKIDSAFSDPYMENGKIYSDRTSLCGSYVDSGINILSVWNRIVPLTNFQVTQHKVKKDASDIVYSSNTTYMDAKRELIMRTNWDLHLNQKRTVLSFKDTPDKLLLDHSNQKVSIISGTEEHILYQETTNERLVNQYIGVFNDFLNTTNIENHKKNVLKTHELLLSNL